MSPEILLANEFIKKIKDACLPAGGANKLPLPPTGTTYQFERALTLERSLEDQAGKFIVATCPVSVTSSIVDIRTVVPFTDEVQLYLMIDYMFQDQTEPKPGEKWERDLSVPIERVLTIRWAIHEFICRSLREICLTPTGLTRIYDGTPPAADISSIRASLRNELDTVAIFDEPSLNAGIVKSVMTYPYKMEYA